jgi:tetratricopeptide (TPR) repeat protein
LPKPLSLLLLILCCFPAFAQKPETDEAITQNLLSKYAELNDSALAASRISELLRLTNNDMDSGRMDEAFRKLQLALILEKYVPHPCPATFALNKRFGDLFREVNVPYAIHYFNKTIAIGLRSTEQTDLFDAYNILAGLYLKTNEHDRALNCYRQAMKHVSPREISRMSSLRNNIGWFYARIGKNDSAMLWFQRALSFFGQGADDHDLHASIQGNIARIKEQTGDYNEALRLLRSNERIYLNEHSPYNFIDNRAEILRVESRLNMRELGRSIDSLSEVIDANREVNQKNMLRFYKFSYDYFIAGRDVARAVRYNEKYNKLKDLLFKKDEEKANTLGAALLSAQSVSFKNEYELYQLQLHAAQMASYKNKVIAILFLITGLLVITILVVYIRKRRKDLEITKKMAAAELKAKELEKRAIRNELELKKKDLTNLVLHNTRVYETNREMIGRLQRVSADKKDLPGSLNTLLTDLKNRNQVGEPLLSLQSKIDKVNTEFYSNLRLRFPQLSKSEIELCGYIQIKLSTKDISLLKNVETESVRKSKTRLKKKLGLEPESDLSDFIGAL